MAATPDIDVPLVLREAHDEVMLALWAETDADEADHRRRAHAFVRDAIRVLSDQPRRTWDWSALAT